MSTGRLEAFSDAVIAILMTIMVLELDAPEGTDLHALGTVVPLLLIYVLSFVYLGIYWNNHHHLLAATERVNGRILWANLHLLFWLSLVPFTMRWMGESDLAALPTAVYGGVLLLAALAYRILLSAILTEHGPGSTLENAVGSDVKGWTSVVLYAAAVPLAFVEAWVSIALYAAVALIWVVPDRRIESTIAR